MVRIENYRVIKKLMLVAKPNVVLNHFFDHMGDKRSLIREDVLNIVMYALLTFPSNEFDLKVCIVLSMISIAPWLEARHLVTNTVKFFQKFFKGT